MDEFCQSMMVLDKVIENQGEVGLFRALKKEVKTKMSKLLHDLMLKGEHFIDEDEIDGDVIEDIYKKIKPESQTGFIESLNSKIKQVMKGLTNKLENSMK